MYCTTHIVTFSIFFKYMHISKSNRYSDFFSFFFFFSSFRLFIYFTSFFFAHAVLRTYILNLFHENSLSDFLSFSKNYIYTYIQNLPKITLEEDEMEITDFNLESSNVQYEDCLHAVSGPYDRQY